MAQRAATDSDLLALYPELSTVNSALRAEYLTLTEEMIDIDRFLAKASQAQCALAGHFLALNASSGVSGGAPIKSKKIDKISASYAVESPPGLEELASTRYGLHYILIERTIFCGPIVAGPRNL